MLYHYKWKKNLRGIKGCDRKEKKMPTPRHKVIYNPIPTALLKCVRLIAKKSAQKQLGIQLHA